MSTIFSSTNYSRVQPISHQGLAHPLFGCIHAGHKCMLPARKFDDWRRGTGILFLIHCLLLQQMTQSLVQLATAGCINLLILLLTCLCRSWLHSDLQDVKCTLQSKCSRHFRQCGTHEAAVLVKISRNLYWNIMTCQSTCGRRYSCYRYQTEDRWKVWLCIIHRSIKIHYNRIPNQGCAVYTRSFNIILAWSRKWCATKECSNNDQST